LDQPSGQKSSNKRRKSPKKEGKKEWFIY
jgi:hypothetical protein